LKNKKTIRAKLKKEREYQVQLENRILITAIVLGLLFAIILLNPQFIGFFTAQEGTNTINLNLSISDTFTQDLTLEKPPTSIRLSGTLIGNGTVNAYLETPTALYLIFDESYLVQKGTIEITALAVANVSKEKKDENKTKDVKLNETITLTNTTETNQTEINATKNQKITIFESICRETCSLINVSDQITLRFEVKNATLNISSLTYTYSLENITNKPPILTQNISNISITKNTNYTLDLSNYFSDEESDPLIYSATSIENITIHIENSIVTLQPQEDFTGSRTVRFASYDGTSTTFSNTVNIEVNKAENITVSKNETRIQILAEIGKPVKIKKIIKLNETIANLTVNISAKSKNITVRKIIDNQKFDVDDKKVKIKLNKTEIVLSQISKELTINMIPKEVFDIEVSAEDNAELTIEDNVSEVEIEYYTPAPESFEENISSTRKNITLSSELPYINVLAYTNIIDVHQELIKLYWYVNESEFNHYNGISTNQNKSLNQEKTFKLDITNNPEFGTNFVDTNNNSLIDRIEWIAPHLSNQTFEINISVLNVQSFPTVGGNWTIRFLTFGTANLSIIAINETTYTEDIIDSASTVDDLKILDIKCGDISIYHRDLTPFNQNISFILKNDSEVPANDLIGTTTPIKGIKIKDYQCSNTGFHTVQVITQGIHNQMLIFGNATALANNFAQFHPTSDIIRFADFNLTNSFVVLNNK